MKIIDRFNVPTGTILIAMGEKDSPLEFLSLGDYGKEKNIKADFMGITRELNGVPHGDLLPLTQKWVITISSQYGCSQKCTFCDVPKVGPGKNATFDDLIGQVELALSIHPEITHTKRLNLHYARMGEPTFNRNVINSSYYLAGMFLSMGWGFHPVVSTMMPMMKGWIPLVSYLKDWMNLKNIAMSGNAGLQLSINSTSDFHRKEMFQGCSYNLEEISLLMREVIESTGVKGRKISLNFALTDAPIRADDLKRLFDPQYFMVKITPMHMTKACADNHIVTKDGYASYYPYKKVEDELKAVGFDVIVFIPSLEEDMGRITCGNAILSGTRPEMVKG